MAIQYSKSKKGNISLTHDPNDIEIYTLVYRPEVWSSSKEVIQDSIIFAPVSPNGCMYLCVQGGVTGLIEPTRPTKEGSLTVDGTAKFKTIPYSLLLQTGDTISANVPGNIPAYELIYPDTVTIDNIDLLNGSILQFRITTAPTSGSFDIISRVSVLKPDGLYTRYDNTITIILKDN